MVNLPGLTQRKGCRYTRDEMSDLKQSLTASSSCQPDCARWVSLSFPKLCLRCQVGTRHGASWVPHISSLIIATLSRRYWLLKFSLESGNWVSGRLSSLFTCDKKWGFKAVWFQSFHLFNTKIITLFIFKEKRVLLIWKQSPILTQGLTNSCDKQFQIQTARQLTC